MFKFLEINSEYIFWFNVFLLIFFLLLKSKEIIYTFRFFKKVGFKPKEFFTNLLKLLFPFIPLAADSLSQGYFSRYVDKSFFIYMSVIFYLFLIIYLIINIKSKKIRRPFFNTFVIKKKSFDKFVIYFFIIMIFYPLFADLYIRQTPNIFMKIISKNANHFFLDSTKENLDVFYELEVRNNSAEVYDIYITTYYSTFISEVTTAGIDDTSYYDPPCCNSFNKRAYVFPNSVTSLELLKIDVFLPNLYNFPINLNSSKVVTSKTICDSCDVKVKDSPFMGLTSGITHIADFVRRDFNIMSHALQFPLYWRSKIMLENKGIIKYIFYCFGYISHQPYILDNTKNAFAITGNYVEFVGLRSNYEYFKVVKTLDEKIWSCIFLAPDKNSLSNCYNLTDCYIFQNLNNNKILLENTSKTVFFYTYLSSPLDNKDLEKYIKSQYSKYLSDSNRLIIVPNYDTYRWYK